MRKYLEEVPKRKQVELKSPPLLIYFCFSYSGHSIIHILPEISCKGLARDDIPNLLAETQQLMQTEYDKLSAEVIALSYKKVL